MKLILHLAWTKKGEPVRRAFKAEGARLLFEDYFERLGKYMPAEAAGGALVREARECLWVCDRKASAKAPGSEELAAKLRDLQNRGIPSLRVAVGPPSGFAPGEVEALRPDWVWSFGPLTLPHELAAVIAAEQLYRAHTILSGHPYHCGH